MSHVISLSLDSGSGNGGATMMPIVRCELKPLGVKFRLDLRRDMWHRSHSACCDEVFRQARMRGAKPQCSKCGKTVLSEDISGSFGPSMENLFDGVDPLRSVLLAVELAERAKRIVEIDQRDLRAWWRETQTYEGPL